MTEASRCRIEHIEAHDGGQDVVGASVRRTND
jgi:hypothetical protein